VINYIVGCQFLYSDGQVKYDWFQWDVTRRTVLRDVQEIKKKIFLSYDKKEALRKLK